jgi:hypothetical protein
LQALTSKVFSQSLDLVKIKDTVTEDVDATWWLGIFVISGRALDEFQSLITREQSFVPGAKGSSR